MILVPISKVVSSVMEAPVLLAQLAISKLIPHAHNAVSLLPIASNVTIMQLALPARVDIK